jgi:hypothetical protein
MPSSPAISTPPWPMTDDPHLNHVASIGRGASRHGVQAFYRDHLVGKFFPPDVTMTNVSRTVGHDQVVEARSASPTRSRSIGSCPASAHWKTRRGRRRRHRRIQGRVA